MANAPQLTDSELGRWYVKRHKNDTMAALGQWYRYDSGIWGSHHELQMDQEIWTLMEEFEKRSQCRPTSGKKSSIMSKVRAELYVPDKLIDADENLISLGNGIFDIQDCKLYEHSPDHYLTTQLPFDYDPEAKANAWALYLASTFVKPESKETDTELVHFVQEAIGYSLTTSVKHHVTFWCSGEGNNGKGVLFHVLEQLVGDASISLNVGLLKREQYQLAMLPGKKIALCSESSATQNLVEDALIKALVAGDTMNVRMIRERPFELHPKCKLWWSMNSLPAVADSSHGFWRRVRLIPFNRVFAEDEMIVDLKSMLSNELPGIFNWAVEGLERLRERGHFEIPAQVKNSTEEYKKESNPVQLFVDDECYSESDQAKSDLITAVYSSYKNWCLDNGYKPLASRRFKSEMHRLGHDAKKTPRGFVYIGIGLKI